MRVKGSSSPPKEVTGRQPFSSGFILEWDGLCWIKKTVVVEKKQKNARQRVKIATEDGKVLWDSARTASSDITLPDATLPELSVLPSSYPRQNEAPNKPSPVPNEDALWQSLVRESDSSEFPEKVTPTIPLKVESQQSSNKRSRTDTEYSPRSQIEADAALARQIFLSDFLGPDNAAVENSGESVEIIDLDDIDDSLFDSNLHETNNGKEIKEDKTNSPFSESRVAAESELEYPDLHGLFAAYDEEFFGGSLKSVEVRWSSRMTLCAGLCVYHRGGYCSIRLSEPLLKFRSVKDYRSRYVLQETLLHEMIHAYLFVTRNRRDRSSHGPEFCSHMRRINAVTGLNITVYHSFHDEVDHYRKHIWRCNGPCRKRPPYYGWLRRAMNRAPGPSDFWWSEHQSTCGGRYEKFAGPEKPEKKNDSPAVSTKKSQFKKKPNPTPTSFAGAGRQTSLKTLGTVTAKVRDDDHKDEEIVTERSTENLNLESWKAKLWDF